jgi:putative membrane protein
MKKTSFSFVCLLLTVFLFACNDSNENSATATDTGDSSASAVSREAGEHNNVSSTDATTGATGAVNQSPLNAADSTFAMKAATGSRMEIEAGNLAQQNAQSERVKNFGAMMVQDHQAANQELMTATGRGMNMPDTLPAAMRKMADQLRNLKGKAFDNRYMTMMVEDHRKTIADFQKQANSGTNDGLKAFAQRTLPALQKHLDSAVAINNAIK